ncbi:MAG TPA: methyltransferase domain-containing protein [Steroidobacteraceae bacterium]|nr:methyltransferase domain-containing protein [Steroidobacteraceae bacterium]
MTDSNGSARLDGDALQALLGRVITDFSGAMQAALVVLGDRLGLYRALAASRDRSPAELAAATGTAERYVQEWLNANAASGYVDYLPQSGRYRMSTEQAGAFADPSSPAFAVGGFEVALAAVRIVDRLEQAFRSGEGIGWEEHHHGVFHGTERFFRSGYAAHLVADWIPALGGTCERLRAGATVADVGCGHGASTILMARAFPESRFHGFDLHGPSLEIARARAEDAGVADRICFERAAFHDFPGRDYDLIAVFDALHDTGDPVRNASHVHAALKPDGCFMVVEPNAADTVEGNLNPVGRAYYAASTLLCTPCALKQGRIALGAQAGEARLRSVLSAAGFGRIDCVTRSPFNMVLAARP